MTTIRWRSTLELNRKLYLCDLCGSQANTIHFLPWVCRTEELVFACAAHDPGGYWIFIDDWRADRADWIQHISGKVDSDSALIKLSDRESRMSEIQAQFTTADDVPPPQPQLPSQTDHRRRSSKGRPRDPIARRTIIEVIARDGLRCHLCGDEVAVEQVQLDHIIPFSAGGPDTSDNLRVAHAVCNNKRGAQGLN